MEVSTLSMVFSGIFLSVAGPISAGSIRAEWNLKQGSVFLQLSVMLDSQVTRSQAHCSDSDRMDRSSFL